MRALSAHPRANNAMNLFGLFFALFASTLAAVLLMALYAIHE